MSLVSDVRRKPPRHPPPTPQIPAEVLLEILKLCLDKEHPSNDQLLPLRRVCKAWNALILDTPSLWTTISCDARGHYIQSIKRSRDQPLRLVLDDSGPEVTKLWTPFLEIAGEQVHRWRSVSIWMICAGTSFEEILEILSQACLHPSAPLLEDIDINVDNISGDVKLDIFPQGLPSLRHLRLEDLEIPWDSSLLTNLKSLCLSYLDRDGPDLRQTVAILTACPQLVNLTLQYWPQEEDSVPIDTPLLQLPLIQSLNLSMGEPHAEQLLDRIRIQASNCHRFIYGDHFGEFLAQPFLLTPQLEHLGPVIAASANRSEWQRLEFDNSCNYFMFKGFTSDGQSPVSNVLSLLCEIPETHSDDLLEKLNDWVWRDVSSPRVQLQLTQGSGQTSLHFRRIQSIVSRLSPFVNSLCLLSDETLNVDKLLRSFSEPHATDASGVLRWTFPILQQISISINQRSVKVIPRLLRRLENMLLARSTLLFGDRLPPNLKTLRITVEGEVAAPDAIQRIKKLVGEVVWKCAEPRGLWLSTRSRQVRRWAPEDSDNS